MRNVAANGRIPRNALVVLTLVALVDAFDMAVARGLLPVIADEWTLSDLQLGFIPTIFITVSVLATVPAGYLSDRVRRTRLIGWTVLSWSALTVLSATALTYPHLLAARAVMGIGQAVDDPASTSLLADVYPRRLRGRVYSVQQVALFLGGGVGLAFGGVVGETLGWRWAFALVGLPGLLLAPAAFRLREPRRGEVDLMEASGAATLEALPLEMLPSASACARTSARGFGRSMADSGRTLGLELRAIFGIATMRYLLVGLAAIYFTLAGVSTWLAIYHERYSGMTTAQATAATGAVLAGGGVVGTLAGGAFSDRHHRRWEGGRIVIVVVSGVAFSALILVSFVVGSVPLSLALQVLGVVLVAGCGPGLRAAMVEVVPPASRGVGASALGVTSALFGTAAAPVAVGALSDATGSLVVAFFLTFLPAILGLLVLLRARRFLDGDVDAALAAITATNAAVDAAGGAPVGDTGAPIVGG